MASYITSPAVKPTTKGVGMTNGNLFMGKVYYIRLYRHQRMELSKKWTHYKENPILFEQPEVFELAPKPLLVNSEPCSCTV